MGWKYKGTNQQIKQGDIVLVSKRIAQENKVEQRGTVTGLQGFITVRLSDGTSIDLDARQVTKL